MSEKQLSLHRIKRIHTTEIQRYANKLLDEGWVLIAIGERPNKQNGEYSYFVLGHREPIESPKSDHEFTNEEMGVVDGVY